MPSLGDRLGDEDPHAPAPAARRGGDARTTRAPRRWAARDGRARARPGGPARATTISSVLERAEDLLERDRAEVAEAEDLAGQLALAAGEDDAAALDLAVERLPVEVVGDVAAVTVLEAWRWSANSSKPSAARPARAAAAQASCRAKIALGALLRPSAAGPRRPGRRRRWPA